MRSSASTFKYHPCNRNRSSSNITTTTGVRARLGGDCRHFSGVSDLLEDIKAATPKDPNNEKKVGALAKLSQMLERERAGKGQASQGGADDLANLIKSHISKETEHASPFEDKDIAKVANWAANALFNRLRQTQKTLHQNRSDNQKMRARLQEGDEKSAQSVEEAKMRQQLVEVGAMFENF